MEMKSIVGSAVEANTIDTEIGMRMDHGTGVEAKPSEATFRLAWVDGEEI